MASVREDRPAHRSTARRRARHYQRAARLGGCCSQPRPALEGVDNAAAEPAARLRTPNLSEVTHMATLPKDYSAPVQTDARVGARTPRAHHPLRSWWVPRGPLHATREMPMQGVASRTQKEVAKGSSPARRSFQGALPGYPRTQFPSRSETAASDSSW